MGQLDFKNESIEVIEELGSVASSDTQSVKLVKIIRDGTEMYSFQKWWKKDPDEDWRVGKGFQLTETQLDDLMKQVKYKI